VLRLWLDRVAVTECGYMNSAMAEPKASVAYAQYCCGFGMNVPVGLWSTGLGLAILAWAASKTWAQPPNFDGR
jgi:hypothetical protein